MNKHTMMRCPKALLDDIKRIKLTRRESYAEVVKRLLDKDKKRLK